MKFKRSYEGENSTEDKSLVLNQKKLNQDVNLQVFIIWLQSHRKPVLWAAIIRDSNSGRDCPFGVHHVFFNYLLSLKFLKELTPTVSVWRNNKTNCKS